jgi:DNA repair ATPase RecN
MDPTLARKALEKIEKQQTVIAELEARVERLTSSLQSRGVSKAQIRQTSAESLSATTARILKAMEPNTMPFGLDFSRAAKARDAEKEAPKPGDGPVAALVRKQLGR